MLTTISQQAGLLSMRIGKLKKAIDKTYVPFTCALVLANISLAAADDEIPMVKFFAIVYNLDLLRQFPKKAKHASSTTIRKAEKLQKVVKNIIENTQVAHASGVAMKPNGFANFTPFAHPIMGHTFITLSGLTTKADNGKADRNTFRPFPNPQSSNHIWHHHELVGLMQYVKGNKHTGTGSRGHRGGVLIYEILTNTQYKDR